MKVHIIIAKETYTDGDKLTKTITDLVIKAGIEDPNIERAIKAGILTCEVDKANIQKCLAVPGVVSVEGKHLRKSVSASEENE